MDASNDRNFEGGAVRSADADGMDFCSIPILGLFAVARTSFEGGTKYGRHNYLLGMPAHECLNHAIRHIYLFLAGDRSEPHLEHAAWNVMAAIQSFNLDPEMNAPHLLDPGMIVGEPMRSLLSVQSSEKAEARRSGEYDDLGDWSLSELAEVRTILLQREWAKPPSPAVVDEPAGEPTPEIARILADRAKGGDGASADTDYLKEIEYAPEPPEPNQENAVRIRKEFGALRFSNEDAFRLIEEDIWVQFLGTVIRNVRRKDGIAGRGEYLKDSLNPNSVRGARRYTLDDLAHGDGQWWVNSTKNNYDAVVAAIKKLQEREPEESASSEATVNQIAFLYGGMKFSAENAFPLIDAGIWMKQAGRVLRNKSTKERKPEYAYARGEYRAAGDYPENVRGCPTHTLDVIRQIAGSGWEICLDGNKFEEVSKAISNLD